MEQNYEKIIKALERNKMRGLYAESKAQAVEMVKEMLFDGCTITTGGSVSLEECGVWDLIHDPRYRFADRNRAGLTPEEKEEILRSNVGVDFFFCSTNAITENGELINIDGFCNRIAAISFGPKRVVMIVGKNKIVPTLEEGFLRVKKIAAPKNCVRLNLDTPCAKLGHCVSLERTDRPLMTDGCNSDRRICCSYLVSAQQRIVDRITVILVNEDLGY
ncbi:MAG: lactate utilization protein [Clostridia bacterium]|nr:lactate utilization protein [Clostridia bacterium]